MIHVSRHRMPLSFRPIVVNIYSLTYLIVLFLSCAQYAKYLPDPEKDVNQWVTNFARQMSFSYEYETRMRFVSVEAKGYSVVGKGERVSGSWFGVGDTQAFEYVGLGDVEYSRSGGAWERDSRGEQSDFLTQMARILAADKYEYQGFDDGYWYRFMANVPFLEPERRKEMVGLMKISSNNYLPSFVWAGLPDSSTFWTARLSGFNSARNIKPPVRDREEFLVTGGSKDGLRSLENRLNLLGIDYRIKETADGLLLNVPAHYELKDVEAMLRPGGMVIYGVIPRGKDAARMGYLKSEPDKPVPLSDSLLTERDVRRAQLRFDQRSTPYVSLQLRRRHALPAAIAVEVDSMLIATAAIDTLEKLNRIDLYPDMQYHEMEILRAYILQPLGELEIIPSGGEIH
jgi:hypothetical protein